MSSVKKMFKVIHTVRRRQAIIISDDSLATCHCYFFKYIIITKSEVKIFHFCMSSRPALGSTKPPIQWVPGAISLGVRRPGREADHSLPTSAEVKKIWIYTFIPPYAFMA
jgi:hypothetical protein